MKVWVLQWWFCVRGTGWRCRHSGFIRMTVQDAKEEAGGEKRKERTGWFAGAPHICTEPPVETHVAVMTRRGAVAAPAALHPELLPLLSESDGSTRINPGIRRLMPWDRVRRRSLCLSLSLSSGLESFPLRSLIEAIWSGRFATTGSRWSRSSWIFFVCCFFFFAPVSIYSAQLWLDRIHLHYGFFYLWRFALQS